MFVLNQGKPLVDVGQSGFKHNALFSLKNQKISDLFKDKSRPLVGELHASVHVHVYRHNRYLQSDRHEDHAHRSKDS